METSKGWGVPKNLDVKLCPNLMLPRWLIRQSASHQPEAYTLIWTMNSFQIKLTKSDTTTPLPILRNNADNLSYPQQPVSSIDRTAVGLINDATKKQLDTISYTTLLMATLTSWNICLSPIIPRRTVTSENSRWNFWDYAINFEHELLKNKKKNENGM